MIAVAETGAGAPLHAVLSAASAVSSGWTRPLAGLVVVDREVEGVLFAKMLRRAGHRVETASSHVRAERVLDAGDVDYVLLDFPETCPRRAFLQKNAVLDGGVDGFAAAVKDAHGRCRRTG